MRSLLLATLIAITPACVAGDITDGTGTGGNNGGGNNGGGGDNGGGDNGGGSASTGKVATTVDQTTVNTQLGQTVKLTYTLTSQNDYAGTVTVTPSVTDAGGTAVPGWTLTADQPSVALNANGTATVILTAKIPTDGMELAPRVKLGVSDGTTSSDVTSAFTIENRVIIDLAAVGMAAPHVDWPASNVVLKIRSGTAVTFHNSDTVAHEIHSGGGVPHESGALNPGQDYTTMNVTDDASWYCHAHEGSSGVNRKIMVE